MSESSGHAGLENEAAVVESLAEDWYRDDKYLNDHRLPENQAALAQERARSSLTEKPALLDYSSPYDNED